MISYKPLWKILAEKNISEKQFKKISGLSQNTIQKLKNNEEISVSSLSNICIYLGTNYKDVIENISDNMMNDEKKRSKSKWDSSIPVEKSSYLRDEDITLLNENGFMYDEERLTMLDLFCGAGGFSVGGEWAGFQSLVGVDHFEPAMKTWSLNHPNSLGILGDICKLDPRQIKEYLEYHGINRINLITAGVPCQGFSIANRKHNDKDERNFLFLAYMKFVETFLPDYIILENVSGLRSTAGGDFEKSIKKCMESFNYSVNVKLVNAADYGVPQIRQRLIFVGVRQGVGLVDKYEFPEGDFVGNYRTVKDALSDLPPLNNNEEKRYYATTSQNEYQRLLRGETALHPVSNDELYNHISPNHPSKTIERISSTEQGKPLYSKFKQRIRLNENLPSPTQLAGGIRPQFQFGHPIQPRGLTIRERARLQSFPDSYVFVGGIVQERVQTGNAVPPLMIYNLLNPIAQDIRRRDDVNVQNMV